MYPYNYKKYNIGKGEFIMCCSCGGYNNTNNNSWIWIILIIFIILFLFRGNDGCRCN